MDGDTFKDGIFDGKKFKNYLSDEAGQMPFKFIKGGSQFRWDVLKMAYEMSHPKSNPKRVIELAEEIINWVNETEPKLPKI